MVDEDARNKDGQKDDLKDEQPTIEKIMEMRKQTRNSADERFRVMSDAKFFITVESNGDETLSLNKQQFAGEAIAAQIETWFDDAEELHQYVFPILRQLAVLYDANSYLTDQPDNLITIREVLLYAIQESGDPFLDSMVDMFHESEDEDEQ